MRADVTVAYLRDQIDVLTGERPSPNRDGAMRVVLNGVTVWISVTGRDTAVVRVMGVVAEDVLASPQVQRWVGDLNCELSFVRAWCTSRTVLIGTELWADELTPLSISRVLDQVVGESQRAIAGYASAMRVRPRQSPEDRFARSR